MASVWLWTIFGIVVAAMVALLWRWSRAGQVGAPNLPGAGPPVDVPAGPPDMGRLMTNAKLKSRQPAVSWPKVQRFVERLRKGEEPPAIQVDDDVIVCGYHRYVAGMIVGRLPPIRPGRVGYPKPTIPWAEVKFDLVDWGGDA